ncbi:MAG TPA: MFS transporter [Gammaproteobacteria bacterium]|nr:MFS transporter [Gammaproteobacteria bacterium]
MTKGRVLFASLIGTTIEFFDFYIYGTAAVLVFPQLFFPTGNATTAMLQSLATFALAFFARPVGSALFGHFGDRIGRKATLVAALLTMGLSTVAIGLLPTYATIGIAAPALLALCRFGQGLGLGGEWGGAVLLATENAPRGKESWYGMFPQLGAPLGFFCSTGIFIALTASFSDADFLAWGWRIPFLASAVLVGVGLWVRLSLTETPAFQRAIEREERVRVPLLVVAGEHARTLVLATLAAITTFVVFYLMTVFTLSWGTTALGFSRQEFLPLQMIGVLFFAATIPLTALAADRVGRWPVLIASSIAAIVFGLVFEPLFSSGDAVTAAVFLSLGLALMGCTYGALGSALAELFPTAIRYTGASLTFNLAGIFGGSLAPYIATYLAASHGIAYVGYYLSAAAALTLTAQLMLNRRQAPHPASERSAA